MRRTKRGRFWHAGLLFLVYSCLHVYSDKVKNSPPEETVEELLVKPTIEKSTTTPAPTFQKDIVELFSTTTPPPNSTLGITEPTTPQGQKHAHPTWRPKRVACAPPAIEQFPKPLMGPGVRKHGGLILHVLVAVFTFLGLAIVCDDYFVASLDRICEELKLSPDIAGASFMAAGSSAPELATVVIGVFFAKDDIGISGVIGSAVFNIMFVISVCALCTAQTCQLNWWPLVRDCFFYALSILVMLFVIINDTISWVEALIMLICYVGYCIALHFNDHLERWAHSLNLPIKLPSKDEQSSLVTYKNVPEPATYNTNAAASPVGATQQPPQQEAPPPAYDPYADGQSWDPNAAWGQESAAAPTPAAPGWNNGHASSNDYSGGYQQNTSSPGMDQSSPTTIAKAGGTESAVTIPTAAGAPTEQVNPLERPTSDSKIALATWAIVYPIHYMCRLTMPDVRQDKYRNWYPFTFMISMVWISFYSYFMVWMITIIGSTLGIPDTVMGLTFVAAGVSVPDALSSIAVIKEGHGDMAVSNAIGSNVFDILICLGLPWFLQTAVIAPGSHVNVYSKGLTYSTMSLLSTVVFLLISVHLNGWKLDRKLGVILMIWYLFFITLASLYELNFFGYMNPPECGSSY